MNLSTIHFTLFWKKFTLFQLLFLTDFCFISKESCDVHGLTSKLMTPYTCLNIV